MWRICSRTYAPSPPHVCPLAPTTTTALQIGCYEGGCGACTVVVSYEDATTGTTVYEPVNSCLRPLCSMGGMNVITAEGIGSKAKGYHPIQTALADNNGSQCGFCSVGCVARTTCRHPWRA